MIRLTALFLILCSGQLLAQDFLSWKYNDRYFSLQAGTGSANFIGDVTGKLRTAPNTINLGYEARLLTHFSTRIEIFKYQLEGKDRWAEFGSYEMQRNHKFASDNWEGNLQVIYYLKPYAGDYYSRHQWDPYLGLGIGITTYNPYREYRGEKYFLRDLATEENKENYGTTATVIPATAGIKFKVNDYTNLIFEIGYRIALTDYLDDVSGKYPNPQDTPDDLLLNDLANPKDLIPTVNEDAYDQLVYGADRGDKSNLDSYLFLLLKAEFYLPRTFFSGNSNK